MTAAGIAARGYEVLTPVHPYYPPGLDVPGYVPNSWSIIAILPVFFGVLGAYMAGMFFLTRRIKPSFSSASFGEQALFLWFITCGGLHCFFESYFVIWHASIAGSQSVLAQLWKEYALSDSRYVVADPFMLCIEGITAALYGPICYLTAGAIVAGHGRPAGSSGVRYMLQAVISTAHLYGTMLYYGTVFAEVMSAGVGHCRPEFLYVYVYFVGFNAPWVVVPSYALYQSFSQVSRIFREHDSMVQNQKAAEDKSQ